jgi:hypothetical protein
MAKSITTYTKALRRGNAAKEVGKDNIAEIFYKRAKELKPKNESTVNENKTTYIIYPKDPEDNASDVLNVTYNQNFMYILQKGSQVFFDNHQATEFLKVLNDFLDVSF